MMNRPRGGLSKQNLLIVGLIDFIALVSFFRFPFCDSSPPTYSVTNSKMGIVHIVMFEFKEDATAEEIADVRYPDPK